MVLRLATGRYKGKVLASSDTAKELRPTQAVVREAIISTMKSFFLKGEFADYEDFSDLEILDLYSGSGSMGFEFFSNGASFVNFVEYDPKCHRLLKENAAKLQAEDRIFVSKGKLPGILNKVKSYKKSFDLVFFDPPFKFSPDKYLDTLKSVLDLGLIKKSGILLLEYKNHELEKLIIERFPEDLELVKTKEYGDCIIHFVRRI